jgi:cell division protein ZapA
MGQVIVNLNGHHYTIGCADGDEGRLRLLAEDMDKRMSSLVGAVGQVGDARLLVMLSLLLLDEMEEARGGAPVPARDDETAAAAIESLAARMETLAEKLEAT